MTLGKAGRIAPPSGIDGAPPGAGPAARGVDDDTVELAAPAFRAPVGRHHHPFYIVNTGPLDPRRAALKAHRVAVQRDDPAPVLHRRRHHQRFAGRAGTDIGNLHTGPRVAQHRGNLRGFILNFEQAITEFRTVLNAHPLFHPDAKWRDPRRVTFQATTGEPVTKTPPTVEFQRVDPDVCPGLAAHRGKLVLGRLTKRRACIGKKVLRPFETCRQRHGGVIQHRFVKRRQQRLLRFGQCRRGMLVLTAETRRQHRGVNPVGESQRRNHQRPRCNLMPLPVKMPGKPRRRPLDCPEQRADGMPVTRSGIASLLQATP